MDRGNPQWLYIVQSWSLGVVEVVILKGGVIDRLETSSVVALLPVEVRSNFKRSTTLASERHGIYGRSDTFLGAARLWRINGD